MEIKRYLSLQSIISKKSCFLFGPRQIGKSTLIRQEFAKAKIYNLLDQKTYTLLLQHPDRIRQEVLEQKIVIIDEIQKIPELLNEVHLLIEEKKINFLLTGSSARSLRRKGTNLLGGRARSKKLHPFVTAELKELFDLEKALKFGLIPGIYFSEAPIEDLKAYVGDYLQHEIAAEAVTRNISAFSRFLEVAALCHSKMLNYTEVANDSQVPLSTIREYFQILTDTMIGDELLAFQQTKKRKPISTSKFYFFDIGLVRILQGKKELAPKSPDFGEAFESFIYQELNAFTSYHQLASLQYWRSTSQFEVDFIFNNKIAIEVKAKEIITDSDLKSIRALKEEKVMEEYYLVSLEKVERVVEGIHILPWKLFLEKLWAGKLI